VPSFVSPVTLNIRTMCMNKARTEYIYVMYLIKSLSKLPCNTVYIHVVLATCILIQCSLACILYVQRHAVPRCGSSSHCLLARWLLPPHSIWGTPPLPAQLHCFFLPHSIWGTLPLLAELFCSLLGASMLQTQGGEGQQCNIATLLFSLYASNFVL
jgi:hypothetical protein